MNAYWIKLNVSMDFWFLVSMNKWHFWSHSVWCQDLILWYKSTPWASRVDCHILTKGRLQGGQLDWNLSFVATASRKWWNHLPVSKHCSLYFSLGLWTLDKLKQDQSLILLPPENPNWCKEAGRSQVWPSQNSECLDLHVKLGVQTYGRWRHPLVFCFCF